MLGNQCRAAPSSRWRSSRPDLNTHRLLVINLELTVAFSDDGDTWLTELFEATTKSIMQTLLKSVILLSLFKVLGCGDPDGERDGDPDADTDSQDGGDAEADDADIPACPDEMIFVDDGDQRPFCIDAYEHPGVDGMLPTTGLPWYQARDACVDESKQLCDEDQWVAACVGTPTEACTGALGVTGARPDCVSDLGVFDMVGNASEWTATPGGSVSFYIRGGAPEGEEIGCDVRVEYPAEERNTTLGFRCCRQAWRR